MFVDAVFEALRRETTIVASWSSISTGPCRSSSGAPATSDAGSACADCAASCAQAAFADALAAVGEHYRRISKRIVRGLRRGACGEHRGLLDAQRRLIGQVSQQPPPRCDTTPVPSVDTSTRGRVRVACTWKVPPASRSRTFDKPGIPYRAGTFAHLNAGTT
jgi:hypothetical protein